MKKHFFLLFVIVLPFLNSCKQSNAFSSRNGEEPKIVSKEHLTMAVLYQQTAAEYRALCYQAFNIARYQLDQSSKMMGGMKRHAIVVDVDETMLDNSPYEAKCILDNIGYPDGWDEWMNSSSAEPVPGALEFLRYAESKKVDIFYITNRKEQYRAQTLKNLQQLNFPNATDDHLMLKTESSSKKLRRERVSKSHLIIMLIGDNLNDFSEVFEKKKMEERFNLTDKFQKEFGQKFIVLPNAMYGEWEGALYNYDYGQSDLQKSEMRHTFLKGF
jgi:5'-nucleotidase (lipoprotein e(P4) family)